MPTTPVRRTSAPVITVRPRANADRDGDGVPDRYDAAPTSPKNRAWNERASEEYAKFVQTQIRELMRRGVEVDCADLACKLLADFCDSTGLPNPLARSGGKWLTYTEARPGGLPNVHGENLVFTLVGADNLAKNYTRRVNDANGNGVAGADARGQVDVGDLRPGDMLFYDWDDDGKVNHTMNVVDVQPDGRVTLAFGTYENLDKSITPVLWKNLDLSPVSLVELQPGTPDYDKWFGPDNHLWGVRRFTPTADQASGPLIPYLPTPPPPPPAPPPVVIEPPPAPPPPPAPKPAPKKHGWLYFLMKPWLIKKLT